MSFFQNLFRRLSRKQEVTTPDTQHNHPEPLGGDTNPTDDASLDDNNPRADVESEVNIKLEDDSEPEIIVKLEDDSDSEGVTKLRQNTDLQDDTDLNNDSNPDGDANPQVDATEHDSAPEGCDSTNASSRVAKRSSRKSAAERRHFDSLFFDSESSSEDETNRDIPFHFDPSKTSPLPSETNATPQHPLTVQPLTPDTRSTSFSPHVTNESSPLTRSEPSTIARNEASTNGITPSPVLPSINILLFDQAQIADQPRLPWKWSHAGTKTRDHYEPTAVGKWWYVWAQENKESRHVISNIGRIMETELGEQRFGAERCMRCQTEDLECWNYSQRATSQVCNPGSACTRCRAEPRNSGCSSTNRKPKKRKTRPPTPPPPRLLLPKV